MTQPERIPRKTGKKIEKLDEDSPTAKSRRVRATPETKIIAEAIRRFLMVLFTVSSLRTVELLQESGSA
jgi:hypothetical protein